MNNTRKIRLLPPVANHNAALASVEKPGDMVVIDRGLPRAIVMKCPDGCGETLTINLDRRVGKAWRLYRDEAGFSVYPSVWRDTGCESHFVIWDDLILWMDSYDIDEPPEDADDLAAKVMTMLFKDVPRSFVDIADELDRTPWNVNRACQRLVRAGVATEDGPSGSGLFRLV